MDYEFHWVSHTNYEIRRSAEAHIRKDQESGHSPITFCHAGTVVVTLSSPDPFQTTLVGNMKCSCGKARGEIGGRSDGSSITFQEVKD